MYINPPGQDEHRATARCARGERAFEGSWAASAAGGGCSPLLTVDISKSTVY